MPNARPIAVSLWPVVSLVCVAGTGGCALFQGNPSQANIALRKQVQDLQSKVDSLSAAHEADQRALAAWERRSPSEPTLPPDRMAKLFTVHGLQFGRLTGGAKLHSDKPGDDAVKVYLTPTDGTGQPLKAAGAIVVEVFDLAAPGDNRVGRWAFSVDQARELWNSSFLENGYVLTCPWEKPPGHPNLTIMVEFTDELTLAAFEGQSEVKVNLPAGATTAPAGK
jgi:hypothetical protein